MENQQFLALLITPKPKTKNTSKNQEAVSFHSIYKKLSFPKISEQELQKLNDKIVSGEQLGQIIVAHVKEIEFNPVLLKSCLDSVLKTKTLPNEEAAFYILHSCFSWLFFTNLQTKKSSIDLVLLSAACLKDFFPSNTSTSMFIFVIVHITRLFENYNIKCLIPSLKIYFKNPGPDDSLLFNTVFDLFTKKSNPRLTKFSNLKESYMKFFMVLFPHIPSLVTPNVTNLLFEHFGNFLNQFNLDVYKFYGNVLPYTKPEGIINFYSCVFKHYESAIENGDPIFTINENTDCQLVKIAIPTNPQFVFQLNHEAPLTYQSVISEPEIPTVIPNLPEKFLPLSKALIEASRSSETQMIVEQYFITLCQSKLNSPYLIDHVYTMTNILLSFEPGNMVSKILEVVLNSRLFDPRKTIMTKGIEGFEEEVSIRAVFYGLLLRNFTVGFPLFTQVFLPYPLMLSELFLFMGKNVDKIDIKSIQTSSTINNFQKVAMIYSTANLSECENKEEVKQFLEVFTIFLSRVLYTKEIVESLFQSDNFISMFFSFIFEPFLRRYVISTFKFVVINFGILIPEQAADHITTIFESAKHGETLDDYIIIYDLLMLVNSFIRARSEMSYNFIHILETISYMMYHFKNYDISSRLLLECIEFYKLYDEIQFDLIKCLSFVHAIHLLYEDEPPESVYRGLVSLLTHDTTLINQQFVSVLILSSFSNSTRGVQFLTYIFELCKFSQQNAITIHNGRFDIRLLELMNEKKTDENSSDFIHVGLKLVEKMTSIISSTPVVKQFISLLCPIKTKFISPFHVDFLKSLLTIVNQKRLNPTGALPLAKSSSYISVNDIKPTYLQKGFEVTFWLFTESPENSVHLLTLGCKDGHELNISARHNHLTVSTIVPKKGSTNYTFDIKVLPCEWYFISLNLIRKNDTITVTGFFNDNKLNAFNGLWDSWQFTKCVVGMNTEETGYQLGSFGIFTQPNTNSLFSQSPFEIHSNALFYITNMLINEILTLNCKSSNNITADLIGQNTIIQRITFTDALVKLCTIETLLPLYAQLDLPYLNGTTVSPSMAISVTDVFAALLPISRDIQAQFSKRNCFGIISSLLISLENSGFLTFDLYQTFYNIFGSISDKRLRYQLFGYILMSFQLWARAAPCEAARVAKHWEHVLYKEFMTYSVRINTFEIILFSLGEFFPYSPDLDICAIRQSMIKILLFISTTEFFTHSNIKALIGQCISIHEPRKYSHHICDLISLIQMIVKIPNSPLEKFTNIWEDLAQLQHLLNSSDEHIIIYTIDLFANLHETPIFSFITLEQHINVMLSFFATEFTEAFFNQIIVKATTNQGFFPLTFYIAYINKKVHENIMNSLKPKNDLISNVESLFWFFACIFKYEDSFGDYLVDFIMKSKILPLKTIMVVIDVVGTILDEFEKTDSVKIKVINIIASAIQTGEFKENVYSFFEVTLQMLFYKRVGYMSLPLSKLVEVYDYDNQPKVKTDFIEVTKQRSMMKYFQDVENQEFNYVFGISFDHHQNSFDSDEMPSMKEKALAQKVISLIVASNATDYYNAAAMLCLFTHDKDKYSFFTSSPVVAPEVVERLMAEINSDEVCTVDSNSWYSVISPQFQKINEDYASFIHDKYIKIFCGVFEEIEENTRTLFSCTANDLGNEITKRIEEFKEIMENRKRDTLKEWFHIWNRMTFDRSPWEDARKEQSCRHYKRDGFLCWNSYPSKLKLNFNFDDHRLASLVQETGDIHSARKILEQQKELEEKEKQESEEYKAPALLQLSNEIMKVDQTKQDINESPIESFDATYYRLEKESECQFQIFNSKIVLAFKDGTSLTIDASYVSHILMRGILHRPRGLEIFKINGPSIFIIFGRNEKNVFEILKTISSCKGFSNTTIQTLPHKKFFKTLGITEDWENGLISNFEYLLALNNYGGRSFNDPSMYPIFPWIIADYRSPSLDLNNPNSFRDLTKPVGALNPERLEKIQKRPNPSDSFVREPYLYPSGYSSLLYVYLFLIRMEPFTSLHIKAQSGKFDHAPRQFLSIIKAFDMVNQNIQDFRELIPEFFFDNSFLNNVNNFNFGKFEGVPIGDVELPEWAHGNSIEFVYMNRKALESQYVSQTLNKWIDLIWGVKQNGPGAVEANNTFIPYMYESVWSDELISQPGKAEGAEAYLQTCGQIPSQLFFAEHVPKKPVEFPTLISKLEVLNAGIENICFTSIAEEMFSLRKIKLNCVNTRGNIFTVTITFPAENPQTLTQQKDQQLKDQQQQKDQQKEQQKEQFLQKEQSKEQLQQQQALMTVSAKQWKASFAEPDMITQITANSLAVSTSIGKIEIINSKSTESISFFKHLGKITCVAADELYLVTGGNDTATNIFTTIDNYNLLHFFPTFRDEISCCAVSSKFDLVVSGTHDSSLFFFSPSHKIVTRIIDLEKRIPQKVLITNGWGFVVVYELDLEKGTECQCIEVFTVNGDFIIAKPLKFQLQQWTSWKTVEGFDYLLMISKKGLIFTCEVFYMDIVKAYKDKIERNALSVSYSYKNGIIFVNLCDGSVQMIPFRYGKRVDM